MGNLDLKRLKAYGDAFVRKLILNSDASSSEFMQILIQLSKENSVEINIQDYEYYLPQNIIFLKLIVMLSVRYQTHIVELSQLGI